MVGELLKVVSTKSQKKAGVPGYAIIVKGIGIGGYTIEAELIQQAGITSHPPKDSIVLAFPVGEGRRSMYALACKNNNANNTTDPGETLLFSTGTDGKTVQAQVDLGIDGKIQIKNTAKSLKKILDDLITHLAALTTIPAVVGTPLTLNPAVITQLNADKAALALLLKE